MKSLFYSLFVIGLSAALTHTHAAEQSVHLRPSADSPVLGSVERDAFLVAPAEPVTLSDREKERGWKAISYLADFRGFVRRPDVTKDLRVAPGAAVYLTAEDDRNKILTRAHANDIFEVERLSGDWVEVSFRKPVTAFVNTSDSAPAPARVETARIEDREEERTEAEEGRRPVISKRNAIPSDGILRSFEGYLGQPRALFGRQPPYPYQIVDASGNRLAYLDLSKLLITTPLEHFIGRQYEFYGKAEPIEGRRDFVIRVERMMQK